MPRDPFEFDDFFTQDYVATIEKVEFVVSTYGNVQAVFTNRYDEPVYGNDGEARTNRPEYYSIGSAELWMPQQGGTSFTHVTGNEDKRIKSNTGYGMLTIRCMDLLGKNNLLERADKDQPNDGTYGDQMWLGLRFHWVTEGAGEPWTNSKTGQSGIKKGHQLPVEYLPADGIQMALGTLGGTVEFDVEALELPEPVRDDLTVFAKGSTLGEFQSRGISVARELQDEKVRGKLTVALSDTSFYETLRLS